MIQDIYPKKLNNSFYDYKISGDDTVFIFDKDGKSLVKDDNGQMLFAIGDDILSVSESGEHGKDVIYLFSIDDKRYFLYLECGCTSDNQHASFEPNTKNSSAGKGFDPAAMLTAKGFDFYGIREIRDRFAGEEVFAVFIAYHLWRWYADNHFCGRCGSGLLPDKSERALRCPDCGNIVYPRINPAVIVGVTRGDELLITRYNRGYAHNALVAGFTEIGETLEETVAREVMEETGVKVKNIRYYKSQPWGMAQDILVGFFCDAEGDGKITMDKNELKYAEWVKREDIVLQPNSLSLTNEMMRVFKTEGEMNP
ncbi:MAG: NAD(+) diphosphatase [Lachnospiraceae bacterium]|nr:NAD(+) diphosphatase [Lachnospiraceae bacterium]